MSGEGDPAAVWRQTRIPVVYRGSRGRPLLVKLPWREDNREWLRNDQHRIPQWNARWKCWETPQSWLDEVVRRIILDFGHTYLIQPYREKEICAPACWNAMGFKCECSCMGMNHGAGIPGEKWHIVSEACAIQWQGRELSCRLLTSAH